MRNCRTISGALLIGFLTLLGVSDARADEPRIDGELSTGLMLSLEGPHELGTFVDLGASLTLADLFTLRAGVGPAQLYDRHFAPEHFLRTRAELALQPHWGVLRPLLGGGATLTGLSPAVFALAGLGIDITPRWNVGVDVRGGAFWDRRRKAGGGAPQLEGQLHLSCRLF
jgi:hypothetical protein